MALILVTGSSGLVGFGVVDYFCSRGHTVHGIDNNMRMDFFGHEGDTRPVRDVLERTYPHFYHREADVRDRLSMAQLVAEVKPALIVHAAAQPSHDYAALNPYLDWDVNANGTMNLLEAARRYAPDCVFVYMSTNKVYGDTPNEIDVCETETRYRLKGAWERGISEQLKIDDSLHSVFGASKAAADIMVQEYGRYYGMLTCCLRCGCLTGPAHAGVEQHGFLSYLVKCNVQERVYKIYGYGGKQVRDNLHAGDVAEAIAKIFNHALVGQVFNLGGGIDNACSVLEAFQLTESITGKKMRYEYVPQARRGDHRCYYTDFRKFQCYYPSWSVTHSLKSIIQQIHDHYAKGTSPRHPDQPR